jgi:hypothetical protein
MPLGFLQQGPLTSRLGGGEEKLEKDAEIDAEAVNKETGEPDETMPEPEEPAGTKTGLQELLGTKNGSPGGRQTRLKIDALLRVDESGVGKSTMYPSWSAIYLQDGMLCTPGEKGERLARNQVVPTQAQAQSLASGTELTADELEQFARGLVILVDLLVDLPVMPPGTEGWTAEARRTHKNRVEYRLSILCYVAAMAESILARNLPVGRAEHHGAPPLGGVLLDVA